MKLTKGTTKLKRLPRNDIGNFKPSFIANGRRYYIRTAEEGIGILRYSRLVQNSTSVIYDLDVAAITKNIQKAIDLLDDRMRGKKNIIEMALHLHSMREGVTESVRKNYNFTYWSAALFIVREGEDLSEFTDAYQMDKIEDWVKEGYHEHDFYDLVKKKLLEFSPMSPQQSLSGAKPASKDKK